MFIPDPIGGDPAAARTAAKRPAPVEDCGILFKLPLFFHHAIHHQLNYLAGDNELCGVAKCLAGQAATGWAGHKVDFVSVSMRTKIESSSVRGIFFFVLFLSLYIEKSRAQNFLSPFFFPNKVS